MSRINTNVSSLIAQKTLTRSNSQLQESLNRLSTGLRINSGKDDPAGLIASENLRRDITSLNKAITNTERANQLIATGDSALGQISGLLNDIRGLVVEAANTGVLSDEQIAANQLQVDSSLEAIDRIAQVTTFQGRKLLDGSLDFSTTYSSGGATVRDLSIQQANLGTAGSLAVNVDVTTAASQGLLTNNSFTAAGAIQATGTVSLATSLAGITITAAAGGAADGTVGNATDVTFQAAANIAHASGSVTLTNSAGSLNIAAVAGSAAAGATGNATDLILQAAADITQAAGSYSLTATGGSFNITAVAGTTADGAQGNGVTVTITESGAATGASYNAGTNTITVNVNDTATNTVTDISNAINGLAQFNTSGVTGGASAYNNTDDGSSTPLSGGSNGTTSAAYNTGTNAITVGVAIGSTLTQIATAIDGLAAFTSSAATGGGNTFAIADYGTSTNPLAGGSNGTTSAAYNATTNVITASVALGATVTQVAAAIDSLAAFTSSAASGGGNTFATADYGTSTDPLSGGVVANSGSLSADLVIRLSGGSGSEVFNFNSGATLAQIVSSINLVSDATGVQATAGTGVLNLQSTGYGSNATVGVDVISEGTGGLFEAALSGTQDAGTDIVGTINGATASGSGNTLSINTSTLDLSITLDDGSSTDVAFNINGGGAIFQVGPNVVTNNQVRIGIGSVGTASLGGTAGLLYELRSGSSAELSADTTTAASIVDQAINKVTSLRGRLGAFQKTTLETNIASLTDTVTNLTEAESSIRDADFAQETARLTRAQILVQSGTAILQIANQNPQNVLALLRG